MAVLNEMFEKERISIEKIPSRSRAQTLRISGVIKIRINDDIPDDALPGRLVHEGTHAIYMRENKDLTFLEERECFDNAYEIDAELNSSIQENITNEELLERYAELIGAYNVHIVIIFFIYFLCFRSKRRGGCYG